MGNFGVRKMIVFKCRDFAFKTVFGKRYKNRNLNKHRSF